MYCCCWILLFGPSDANESQILPSSDEICAEPHRLITHGNFMKERADVEFGLLDVLLSREVFSMQEFNKVKSKNTPEEKVGKLINYIIKKNGYEDLCSALIETNQEHLVNFLNSNGVYKEECEGVWPILDKHIKILDINRCSLVDLIDPSELMNELFAKGVINQRHREHIESKKTAYRRSEALLDIVRRFSLSKFRDFQNCLENTNQKHVNSILINEGEVVRVHTEIKSTTRRVKVTDTEKELVQRISHLLQNQTTADAFLIMDLVRLGLIGATTGHSIVLHFLCSNAVDLTKLQDSLRSGRCKNLVRTTFHDLLPTKNIGEVDVKKFERDGEFIKRPFTGTLKDSRRKPRSNVGDIPADVLFRIFGYVQNTSPF